MAMEYEYTPGEKNEGLLKKTIDELRFELKLDEGLPNVSGDVRERIVKAIAETVVEVSEVLQIERPTRVGLLYNWRDEEGEKEWEDI